jgi:2-dehydro-3-deoxygluconokinase
VPLGEATSFTRTLAGAEFNVAIGVARLGCTTGWIGRVGHDSAGSAVIARLRGEGVETSQVAVDPRYPTGLLVRDCHAVRPITVEYYRTGSAGSRISPDDIAAEYVAGARTLIVSGITPLLSDDARAAQARALDLAHTSGCCVVFDPNLRTKLARPDRATSVLRPLAARARIVLAGLDEAQLLSGQSEPAAAAGWFLDQGAQLVVIKSGPDGSWATDGTRTWKQPAFRVPVLDPVGAGDAFAAGLLAGILRGGDTAQALREAAAVAALVVATAGDIEGLPSRAVLDAFLSTASIDR